MNSKRNVPKKEFQERKKEFQGNVSCRQLQNVFFLLKLYICRSFQIGSNACGIFILKRTFSASGFCAGRDKSRQTLLFESCLQEILIQKKFSLAS